MTDRIRIIVAGPSGTDAADLARDLAAAMGEGSTVTVREATDADLDADHDPRTCEGCTWARKHGYLPPLPPPEALGIPETPPVDPESLTPAVVLLGAIIGIISLIVTVLIFR